ncbi:hypothetical protein [uncultured Erythrobacter sp.]|uniref:hypothetical protein n=1 Tax=uncultured Erythrobacter sp. TaxID=263913 RepID=UPI00265A9D38|nr:hypothetical protein [uncultured Erythrobacter sp.]
MPQGRSTALVAGDGPAGLIASLVLARAGVPVTLLTGAASPQHNHVHTITADTLRAIGLLVGTPLTGCGDHPAWQVTGHQLVRAVDRPVLDAKRLTAQLRGLLAGPGHAPITVLACGTAKALADKALDWLADANRTSADLCIDATGGSRLILKAREPRLDLLETGGHSVYSSWQGTAAIAHPQVTLCETLASGSTALMAIDGHRVTMTRQSDHLVSQDERDTWLSALAAIAPAELKTTLLSTPFGNHRLAHRAPMARRAAIEDMRHQTGAVLLPIGDALLQTAPRMGKGFAQLAGQCGQLRAHCAAPCGNWAGLAQALAEGADAAFMIAALVGAAIDARAPQAQTA